MLQFMKAPQSGLTLAGKASILLCAGIIALSACGQKAVKQGNTWKQQGGRSVRDTLVTNQVYEYPDGKRYPIILDKSNGHCYIWKMSKSGKKYRVYFTGKNKEYISTNIAASYGVKYVPSKKRK